ncbi:MAG: hypothetical protein ABI376_02060 [Caulobacteraceae bacterium]
MKAIFGAALTAGLLALAAQGQAEPYKDYTPAKGAWQITEVHVDQNHIDDYLTGLRTSWAPGEELAKKHGLIDRYGVFVRMDPAGRGANVLLTQHMTSMATLDPDKARDQAMMTEGLAQMSKEKGAALVAGFDKYRTFVGDGFWQEMDFAK